MTRAECAVVAARGVIGARFRLHGRDPAFVPWEGGHGNPDDPVDRAVLETREAVFPHLGLDALRVDG